MSKLHNTVRKVTDRIIERSSEERGHYLALISRARVAGPARLQLACSNLAHAYAAAPTDDKERLLAGSRPNIGIVTAFNDMLSAHQPFERFPGVIKAAALGAGGTAQVAGGVPAMCDGVTQGQTGMELSLFSRDVIAMSTAVALSHNIFDAALCLGVCDKIVPGLLIGALHFGHLPVVMVPAGPMPTGISHEEKGRIRREYAQGKVDKAELQRSESNCFHTAGTCTFFGTANSNQMLMEIMGLHMPGSAFIPPNTELREELTKAATRRVLELTALTDSYTPIGHIINERTIVNGIVGLLATGGSTNHTLHLVAIARAAGVLINWDDFNDLSEIIPVLAKIYPSGKADVNQFQAAGGVALVIRELLKEGLLHEDVPTVAGQGISRYTEEPFVEGGTVKWRAGPTESLDPSVIATIETPFREDGGLKLLKGNIGRGVIKVSSLNDNVRVIEAPAIVFHDQAEVIQAFKEGRLNRDFVAVVKYQGPRARGMPELHKLTPLLEVLQDKGFAVALVTDGRMSGASGRVPAAIHMTPECIADGPLAKVCDGDIIRLDSFHGTVAVLGDEEEFAARPISHDDLRKHHVGVGRELFGLFRAHASGAEEGATSFSPDCLHPDF